MKENNLFKWVKCDLHFHTPISNITKNDYPSNPTPEEIVKKLKQFNVGLVAITDHNIFDVTQFLKLQEISQNLVNFLPGVELKVDKYDVILIIEPTHSNLKEFDNKIKEFCKEDRKTGQGTTEELVQVFKDFNYILIPEYNRGGGGDTVHNLRTPENDKFKLQLLTGFYDAADIKNVGKHEKTTIHLFKEMFKKAQIAREGNYIYVTDNHDINYYPDQNKFKNDTFRGWTFINSEPTFNGLKMALTDGSRFFITPKINAKPNFIKNRDDFLISKIYIKSIENGEEMELNMSPYLNCIVGPRSSGKSYLVKKIVSKFDQEKENKYKKEYKEFWKKYDIKIKFINGEIIDYGKISDFKKIVYLGQNHVIENLENDNNLFLNWYNIFEILPPNIDFQKINLKKNSLEKNIKSYYESILKIRMLVKELHFKLNIFRSSNVIVNKVSSSESLFNKVKENINQFEIELEKEEDFETLEIKIKNLELNNFYINDKDKNIINENIKTIISIFKKTKQIKEKFGNGLNFVNNYIITQLNKNKKEIQEPLDEFTRLKNKYKQFAQEIKTSLKLKNEIWNNKENSFVESTEYLTADKEFDNWKFIKKIILRIDNEFIQNQLSKIFKSTVYSSTGILNPLINFSSFISVTDSQIFNQKTKTKEIKDLNFVKQNDNSDIIDENNESYINTSPGGKANIILKLLLSKERLKNKIVIIDQPEDSLDNRTIKEWLVKTIKDIKFFNQIIVITHNSNIVINADAQNIIIPNRINFEKIEYLADTFESTKKWFIYDKNKKNEESIFQNILLNLEGGKKTLIKRMNKWESLIIERIDINEIKSQMMPRKSED